MKYAKHCALMCATVHPWRKGCPPMTAICASNINILGKWCYFLSTNTYTGVRNGTPKAYGLTQRHVHCVKSECPDLCRPQPDDLCLMPVAQN
jgi:hypothetical protein